jgi:hypothetical protein
MTVTPDPFLAVLALWRWQESVKGKTLGVNSLVEREAKEHDRPHVAEEPAF